MPHIIIIYHIVFCFNNEMLSTGNYQHIHFLMLITLKKWTDCKKIKILLDESDIRQYNCNAVILTLLYTGEFEQPVTGH